MSDLHLRHPTPDDGLAVFELVRDGGVLDLNSSYAYAATFRNFPKTCVVACDGDRIAGFVTGYRIPDRPTVHFVWQVGVSPDYRGQGIATRMLRWILDAPDVQWLETTVTPSNEASRALFHGLARRLDTDCQVGAGLTSAQLGQGHEDEELFRIGPISRS